MKLPGIYVPLKFLPFEFITPEFMSPIAIICATVVAEEAI